MATSRIKLVISDFHLSRGRWLKDGRRNPLEDFHQDDRFNEFLNYYSTGAYQDTEVELIVNGDFFDPLAVVPLPKEGFRFSMLEYPLEVEEPAAVEKIRTIVEAHPISMDGLKTFLKRGKSIIFRWGNHDASILWPKVQEYLREVLDPPKPEQLTFQLKPYIFDRICIDHGNQFEYLNQFDESNIFIERKTKSGVKRILNLPFGSFFVLGFMNRLKLTRPFINQIFPFRTYIQMTMFMDPIFFVMNGFRVVWFFIKMRFITHPMRFARLKKTFLLMFETFHRPSLEKIAEQIFENPASESLPYDTLIMGHNHQAAVRMFSNGKQYINTGTWTPITSLELGTLGRRVLRTYALIEYVEGAARASLKIWHGQSQITEHFA